MWLHPFEDTYLHSQFENGTVVGGRIGYVKAFAVVAIFILFIASINYTNLATARASIRAPEIGICKTIGARKGSLIAQFMTESILMTQFAALFAASMIQLLIPKFNELTGKQLSFDITDLPVIAAFVATCLGTGILGGVYPALYLSRFNPVRVMGGSYKHRPGAGRLRQGLVVFQFGCSILLIIGTLSVYDQLTYIRSKNLGLERENLLYVRLEGEVKGQYGAFKSELLDHPEFLSVTRSNQNPLSVGNSTSDPAWEGKAPDAIYEISIIRAGFDFVETMKMSVLAGRSFAAERDGTSSDDMSFIINQKMVEIMETDEPVGQQIQFWGDTGTVIGVVQDFHSGSMHSAIRPLIIRLDQSEANRLDARIAAGKEQEAIATLERLYDRYNPSYPFSYSFVDDDFEGMYQNEAVLAELAGYSAILAGFISCLGLFGLASFTAVQRTKEIGIRKTLGATATNLVALLSRDFIKLVAVAFVVVVPLAHHFVNGWLDDFHYRTDLGLGPFALAGGLGLVIAWLTVGSQALRAALANPVDSLRSE